MVEANSPHHTTSHFRYQRGFTKVDCPEDGMVRGSICVRGNMLNFPQNVQTGSGAPVVFHLIGTGSWQLPQHRAQQLTSFPPTCLAACIVQRHNCPLFPSTVPGNKESTKHSNFNESLWQHFHGMLTWIIYTSSSVPPHTHRPTHTNTLVAIYAAR